MKLRLTVMILFSLCLSQAFADEGMWLLGNLRKNKQAERVMKELGLQMPVNKLYLLYFAVHRLFAVVNRFKKRNRMIHFEDFLKLHGGLFTHRLGGAAYVHHSKLLKLLQEFLTLPAEENEGVFHHFVNHSSAPPLLLQ